MTRTATRRPDEEEGFVVTNVSLLEGFGAYLEHAATRYEAGTVAAIERTLDLLHDFLTTVYVPGNNPKTGKQFAKPRYVRHINYRMLAHWRDWRSPQKANEATPDGKTGKAALMNELSRVQKFLCWSAENGYHGREMRIPRNRVAPVEPRPDPPADELVRRILAEAGDVGEPRHAFWWLLFATGMRVGPKELCGLKVRDWNPAENILTIPLMGAESTKRHHRLFCHGPHTAIELAALVAGRNPEDLLFTPTQGRINGWCEGPKAAPYQWQGRFGPCKMSPRKARQWFCGAMVDAMAPEAVTDYCMGHTGTHKTRSHYAAVRPEDCREWMVRVENRLLGTTPP